MRKSTLLIIVIATAVSVVAMAGTNQTHAQSNDMSHLKLTSSASHGSPGSHVDQVINNAIDVRITINDPVFDQTDWGILALRPGATPAFTWTCTSCSYGLFVAVQACPQAGGCTQGDVESWFVGVKASSGSPGSTVRYDIDSDVLGNGYRHHPSPASCTTPVTPNDDTYDATDGIAGWDNATACTDAGVSINLDYEE